MKTFRTVRMPHHLPYDRQHFPRTAFVVAMLALAVAQSGGLL